MLEAVELYMGAVSQLDPAAVEAAATLLALASEDRGKAASAAEDFCEE